MGNLESYDWKKDECLEDVENLAEGSTLNFSDLARRYGLVHKSGRSFFLYKLLNITEVSFRRAFYLSLSDYTQSLS